MTAAKTAPAPSTYVSGHCSVGAHDRCRGGYAGVQCTCPHHTEPEPEREPEPEPREQAPGPAARLTRAAIALDVDGVPHSLPAAAITHLASLLRSEATWAADRADTYPADRAPLLHLADLINGGAT